MDKQKRENIGASLLFIVSLFFVFIVCDWLWRAELFPESWRDFYRPLFTIGKDNLFVFKSAYLVVIALMAYSNPRMTPNNEKKVVNKMALVLTASIAGLIFMFGYLKGAPYYNLIIYPISFLAVTYALHEAVQAIDKPLAETTEVLKDVSGANGKQVPFAFGTDKGELAIPDPTLGFYLEGTAGSGKSVLTECLLYQATQKGYAGVVYDFEGNPLEEDGAVLTRLVYTGLKNAHNVKTRFAFLNCSDLTKSVRCNPLSPKYLKTELDFISAGNTLMKNLEKEWVEKTDFWASNAINVVVGSSLMLRKHKPHFCTIPHLVSFILSDFRAVLNYLSTDKELEPWIMPVMSAYKQQANQQTAGVISSSQLPLTKLFTPEIFWNFAPPESEEFSLDITNKKDPVFFCIGNNPKQKAALSPVIALVLSTCMEQMNQFDRVKSLFVVDELPTIYIPNLDTLPATARKKGVITTLTVQSFEQLVQSYGKTNAIVTRDNLSNQFVGKTNNFETAERIAKLFGEYKKTETSYTFSESGESQTQSSKNERFLQPKDVAQQRTGHWTGFVANGNPPFFHAQFDYFKVNKFSIPPFAQRINTGNAELDRDSMDKLVRENFNKIRKDIADLLAPFMPIDDESEE
jgi:hypothetical protein